MFFLHTIDREGSGDSYTEFRRQFVERFGHEPDFAVTHAYDATRILIDGLRHVSGEASLKETILSAGPFEGLQSSIGFDAFGDVVREHFPYAIVDGRFVSVEQ